MKNTMNVKYKLNQQRNMQHLFGVQFSQSVTKDLWEIMKYRSVDSGQIKVSTDESNKDQLIDW